MRAKTVGVISIGQIAGRLAEGQVPKIVGASANTAPISSVPSLTYGALANAGAGVLALAATKSKYVKGDDAKLAVAILGTRMLSDVVYDVAESMLSDSVTPPTGSGRLAHPVVRVASYNGGGGVVTVD